MTAESSSENGARGEHGEFKLMGKMVELDPVGVETPLALLPESLLALRFLFLPRDAKGLERGD